MVTPRRGGGNGGCLFMVALIAAAVVFGWPTAKVYLRAYEYEDAMRQVLLHAKADTDEGLQTRMRAAADSIGGLPDDAYDVQVQRAGSAIRMSATYTDTIAIPIMPRAVTHRFAVERQE
jgi:hypothetical protein